MRLLNRFDITVTVRNPAPGGSPGAELAKEYPQSDVWGFFTFPTFVPSGLVVPEVFVKFLDARPIGGGFWFFLGGLTDLDFTAHVVDGVLGTTKQYTSGGKAAYLVADTSWSGETPAPPGPPPKEKYRLLLIPVAFDNWVPKESQSFLEEACRCAIDGWNKQFGKTSPVGMEWLWPPCTYDLIYPPWPVPGPVPSCTLTWRDQVLREVRAAGHTGQDIILGPAPPLCGSRSNSTYIISPCDSLGMTLAHEMGHRLGLQHTSSLPLGAQPVDLEKVFAAPWLDQYEYGGYDLMGTGGIPMCPEWILTGYNREELHLPTDRRLTWQRGPGTYLVYRIGDRGLQYELSIVGPYRGHYGGGTRNYIVGTFGAGQTFADITGGTLGTIVFGAGGEVRAE